jgi:hypothetical protein
MALRGCLLRPPSCPEGYAVKLGTRDTLKFAVLVGLLGIFIDASIAHGLFWDNDPYWTYWVTKSFLITTVFLTGTALLGIGIWQGLAITAAHTLVLEVYYQWLAPVGLPQEPEWLDFNHLWITGVPVHYLSILIGYWLAVWIWRRNRIMASRNGGADVAPSASNTLLAALIGTVGLLGINAGLTQGLLLREFLGITFFVQHLLVGVVFVYAWLAYVGTERAGWWVGAIMLALVWATYGLYLAPHGLPNDPPAYLGYDELWMKSFPGDLVAALLVFFGLDRWRRRRGVGTGPLLIVALLCGMPVDSPHAAPLVASAQSQGAGMLVVGDNPVDMKSTIPMTGRIAVKVVEGGNRWSHVQNTDSVEVTAEFTGGGSQWRVVVDRAMPRHPLGRYTTWNGVVFNHAMHGDTGIGTAKLPEMRPAIALYGWGSVWKDGQLVSKMAFTHVMVTTAGVMQGVMLEVETEDKALLAAPEGYLTAMWHDIDAIRLPNEETRAREIIGWITLILLTLLSCWLARRE